MNLIFGKAPKNLPRAEARNYTALFAALRSTPEWVAVACDEITGKTQKTKAVTLRNSAKGHGVTVQIVHEDGLVYVRRRPDDKAPISSAPQPHPTTPPPIALAPTSTSAIAHNPRAAKDPIVMGHEIEQALDRLAKLEPGKVVEVDLGPAVDDWHRVFQKEAAASALAKGMMVEIDRSGRAMIIQLLKAK